MKQNFVLLIALCLMIGICPVLAEGTVTATEAQPALTAEETVNAVYALEDGAEMADVTLTGTVVAVLAPYSEETNNITVTIQVAERTDQLIQCTGLTGEGIAALKEGDEITVTGTIRNENGVFEFAEGCTLQGGEPVEEAAEEPAEESVEEPAEAVEETIEEPVEEPEQSAESLVLGFLSELGIDTKGFEEQVSSAIGEAKSALTDLQSTAGDVIGSIKEGIGGFMNHLGDSLNGFLHEVNAGLEQVQNSNASEIERVKGTLETLLKDATEKDPESEETKALRQLLEDARTLVEDDVESVSNFMNKVIDILKKDPE